MASGDLTVYCGCRPVVDAQYDLDSDDTPTAVILDAVATAADVDPVDLPTLYETIDTDALNQLFAERDGAANSDTILSVQFEPWNIFIRSDGRIRVCDATQPTDPTPVFENSPV